MVTASPKPARRTTTSDDERRRTSKKAEAGNELTLKKVVSGSKVDRKRDGKPVIRRVAGRLYVDGVPALTLVGKHPLVKAQPAPDAPRHFTLEQISDAVERHMKIA